MLCSNCGNELTGSKSSGTGTTTLSFRCSRKVRGKAQLAKIQRTMVSLAQHRPYKAQKGFIASANDRSQR